MVRWAWQLAGRWWRILTGGRGEVRAGGGVCAEAWGRGGPGGEGWRNSTRESRGTEPRKTETHGDTERDSG